LDEFEGGILPTVLSHIPEGSQVAELYSGIGTIGLNIAADERLNVTAVLCSDSNEFVDQVFDKCADSLPEVSQSCSRNTASK
jgi:tRNA G37 N-methylase Trm5